MYLVSESLGYLWHPVSLSLRLDCFFLLVDTYTTIAARYAKICPQNSTDFYQHGLNSTPIIAVFYAYILPIGPLAFYVCPLFFTRKNPQKNRIATVAIFRCDLYAAVFRQMSPPPPTKNCARLRTTTYDYVQLSTVVDFIVLSIKLVFIVLGVSYSRVLAQRPTGYCSASTLLSLTVRGNILDCVFFLIHHSLQGYYFENDPPNLKL